MTSTNGSTWFAHVVRPKTNYPVTYGLVDGVRHVRRGRGRRNAQVMTSTGGVTWTPQISADQNNWTSKVAYGEGQFVAVAGDGTNRVMTSPDSVTWTADRRRPNLVVFGDVQRQPVRRGGRRGRRGPAMFAPAAPSSMGGAGATGGSWRRRRRGGYGSVRGAGGAGGIGSRQGGRHRCIGKRNGRSVSAAAAGLGKLIGRAPSGQPVSAATAEQVELAG